MRTTGFWLLALMTLALPAIAQTTDGTQKMSGKAHCAKPDPDDMVQVGDKPGHALMMTKSTCTWTDGQVAGLTPKSADDVATGEMNGAMGRNNGYHIVTMDNGDKYTVRYMGTAKMAKDNTGTFEGKWTFVSGTGKLRGIKGSGTYNGIANADGSGDVTVDGNYTLAPEKPAVKKK